MLLPLGESDLPRIDTAVRSILTDIGIKDAPDVVTEAVTAVGGWTDSEQRLHYSPELLDTALKGFRRGFTLCGRDPSYDLRLEPNRVHVGTGGAAPLVWDLESGRFRESTLQDLLHAASLVDTLDNIHFFSRPLVARDIPDPELLDINTAYACLAGTRKHVLTSASQADHIEQIARMCAIVAGGSEAFFERPFLSINCNLLTPPLRFDPGACEVAAAAVRLGLPLHCNTFGQMGASSPVCPAGSIAQTVAETLAGMIFAWLIEPTARLVFGARTLQTDLRTGAMSGGSPEGALTMAAIAQMANYYGLPNSVIAGATDSKVPDAQSGYEKALSITLAAQAGANMITQAGGSQASLMGCTLESYVIDNDMLGAVMKSLNRIEVYNETLALDSIREVAHGEGHFLGQPETLERMQSDFVYPEIADRRSIAEWELDGDRDIRDLAETRTRNLLQRTGRNCLSADTDHCLRLNFDIRIATDSLIYEDD